MSIAGIGARKHSGTLPLLPSFDVLAGPRGTPIDRYNRVRIMSLHELFVLLLLLSGGCIVWFGLKAREAAVEASRAACKAEELQFLDDTVALESVRPVRDDEGRLRLRRIYGFEYSDTGNNRRRGAVTMVGSTVVTLYLAPRHTLDRSMWY